MGGGYGRGVLALLIALFILVPLIEITVLIQVGQAIGVFNTIGAMILVSVVGAWLARHEGFVTLQRIQQATARGQIPGNELIDGFLILVAGLLMLTPGFVTDAIALTVLFPPTRVVYRAILRRRFDVRSVGFSEFTGFGDPGRGPRDPRSPRHPRDRGPDDVIDV